MQKWNVFESTMKASYKTNAMFPHLDESGHVKVTGKDHESGWVRDRSHDLAGLSDHLTNLERGIQSVTLANSMARHRQRSYRVTQLGTTGYNRSDAVVPESDSSHAYPIPPLSLERLRKTNPEEHAFFTHSPANRDPTLVLTNNGKQQPTAAIHNTPDPALLSAMQFRTWETSYSASYDPRASTKLDIGPPASPIRVNRAHGLHSGYTMSNKFEFEPMVKAGEALRGPAGKDGADPRGIADGMQRMAAESRDRSVAKQRV
ncbi:hypothetical protein BCR44DRAFT_1424248 [Catenaria anguillulae PL171]|uniref:Uncharacterized protein n=1 Tax=Catenaria anguillulae PL171 TaxID=765915 RepID=A0A1Y2I2E7_9FUNG|nr:hypothetical protein BCR44DRAFT_1424248 [Catenaria anguillulae PL171]